ncbi:hypothetical protein U3516DRAFT_596115, partial [Neocallimastix sp. 'constans']
MLTQEELQNLELERKYFIESNRSQATWIQWVTSKGTSFDCYVQYLDKLSQEDRIDNKIEFIRTIIYALHKPFQFTFFYWTILVFILYKFNFKRRIMKIILIHLILRSLGDILDKFGDLFPRYYSYKEDGTCDMGNAMTEMHPFKWVLTRQIGSVFWYTGEIVADWYPLLRTREIVKNPQSIWFVYVTCIIFNLSKVVLIILHFFLRPSDLYGEDGVFRLEHVHMFYFIYWIIQLFIIYASVFYDISVYTVLKKYTFQIINSQISFVKKFKTFSEYRINVSLLIGIFFLPLFSISVGMKFYYYFSKNYHSLEFSFEELRRSVANLQYFIIYIDQILLSYSDEGSKMTNNSLKYNDYMKNKYQLNYDSNYSSNKFKNETLNKSFDSLSRNSPMDSTNYKNDIIHLHNNDNNYNNTNNGSIVHHNYNKYSNNNTNDNDNMKLFDLNHTDLNMYSYYTMK